MLQMAVFGRIWLGQMREVRVWRSALQSPVCSLRAVAGGDAGEEVCDSKEQPAALGALQVERFDAGQGCSHFHDELVTVVLGAEPRLGASFLTVSLQRPLKPQVRAAQRTGAQHRAKGPG